MALGKMVREIRRVKNATAILTAAAGTFKFIDTNSRTITYDLSGGSLRRTLGVTPSILAVNVDSLVFAYYDYSGTPLTNPAVSPQATDIVRIRIDLSLSAGGEYLNLRSYVSPRRL